MTGKLTGKLADAPRRGWRPAAHVARAVSFQPRRPAYLPAKAVGSFVPKLTRKAFQKYGFSAATLVTDWAQIAGADLAGIALPERLKWPRGVEAYGEVEEGAQGRPGATLMLRVDPARALDVEYRSRQIIERINAYFGYRAVAELRLLQAPLDQPGKVPPLPAPEIPASAGDPLARALARLKAGVMGQAGGPPRTA